MCHFSCCGILASQPCSPFPQSHCHSQIPLIQAVNIADKDNRPLTSGHHYLPEAVQEPPGHYFLESCYDPHGQVSLQPHFTDGKTELWRSEVA